MITKKNRNKSIAALLCAVLLLIAAVFAQLLPSRAVTAHAEDPNENKYTGVLEDLERDEFFDINEYPVKDRDNSLSLFQIAESTDGELFVYVYQPSGGIMDLRAVSIRISTSLSENPDYSDYDLKYIDNENTVYKYFVSGLSVRSEPIRYYDIPCIFRKWNESMDPPADNDNDITQVAYEVNRLWKVTTSEGGVEYRVKESSVIEVTDKYVGTLFYGEQGIFGDYTETYSFFIAFNTDIVMEKLYEADVEFSIDWIPELGAPDVGETQKVTVNSNQTGSGKSGFYWWSQTHTWNCIEPSSSFIEKEDLYEDVEAVVKKKAWVVRFYEITDTYNNITSKPVLGTFRASNTSILRLKFLKDGEVYDLGVVDNKQTSSGAIGNYTPDPLRDWLEWFRSVFEAIGNFFANYWYWFVIGLFVILALIILSPFLPSVFTAIWHGIVWLIKKLWWLLSAPFRLIYWLFKGRKDE